MSRYIDVQEVTHGYWLGNHPVCSECNHLVAMHRRFVIKEFKFCPYCGAKMDKESEDKTMIESTKQNDNVNHPSHYTAGGIECKDALASALMPLQGYEAFCTGNAIKYLWRWKLKNGVEDLKKARWYIDRLIEKEERVVSEE